MKKINFLFVALSLLATSCNASGSNKYYTITFTNSDGSILETVSVKRNEMPTYSKETPTKTSSKKSNFEFSGWEPSLSAAKKDATYVATYTSSTRQYLVEFLDYDYSVLDSKYYDYGSKPVDPGTVTKSYEDDYFKYTFASWDSTLKAITADKAYYPIYEKTPKTK